MKKIAFVILVMFFHSISYSQLIDSFSDNDFSSSPTWVGDTGDWQIVTNSTSGTNTSGSNTLRLDAQLSASGTKYLSTQKSGSWGSEQSWGFWIGRRSSSAATSTNQTIIWLWANESDLTSGTVDGYRIKFGDSSGDDEIILERVDNGSVTTVITSSGAVTNGLDDIGFLIRVTRSSGSVWNLYTSTLPSASGNGDESTSIPSNTKANVSQGSATDNTYTSFDNGYFGITAIHSSGSTARAGLEFDQLYFDTDAASPLPVALVYFKEAASKLNNVKLSWQTVNEINNYGFEIERCEKRDVKNEKWQRIGFVSGHGNSNSPRSYFFIDEDPIIGESIYRLKQIDFDGSYEYSDAIEITFNKTVNKIKLEQNYPNPFNPVTKINYTIPSLDASNNAYAQLKVYDAIGNEIITLVNETLSTGSYSVLFDGSGLSSGVYYYKLEIENFIEVKKMILLN